MKKFYIIVLFVFYSCSTARYNKFDYNVVKNPWISAFKDQVFFFSLREGYQSDSLFSMIAKKDAFNPYDGISKEALDKATGLGKLFIKNMPEPIICEGCPKGMNYYMANALHYYNSSKLDSIATAEYKKHLQEDRKIYK